jgi:hypothetical protein
LNNLSVTLDCNSNKLEIIGKFAIVLNITSPESPVKDYFILIIIITIIVEVMVVVVVVVVVIVIAATVIVAPLLVITKTSDHFHTDQ